MDISFTVCLFVCNFVRLRICSARIKLAASNFAWWFSLQGVLGRESPILGNFAPQKPKIGRIGHPPGSNVRGWKSSHNGMPINIAWRVDVEAACLDIRRSPKTDVLICCSFCVVVSLRWRFGVAVTALGVSTKLLYVEPG